MRINIIKLDENGAMMGNPDKKGEILSGTKAAMTAATAVAAAQVFGNSGKNKDKK